VQELGSKRSHKAAAGWTWEISSSIGLSSFLIYFGLEREKEFLTTECMCQEELKPEACETTPNRLSQERKTALVNSSTKVASLTEAPRAAPNRLLMFYLTNFKVMS